MFFETKIILSTKPDGSTWFACTWDNSSFENQAKIQSYITQGLII
jgi:hypothetical protein